MLHECELARLFVELCGEIWGLIPEDTKKVLHKIHKLQNSSDSLSDMMRDYAFSEFESIQGSSISISGLWVALNLISPKYLVLVYALKTVQAGAPICIENPNVWFMFLSHISHRIRVIPSYFERSDFFFSIPNMEIVYEGTKFLHPSAVDFIRTQYRYSGLSKV